MIFQVSANVLSLVLEAMRTMGRPLGRGPSNEMQASRFAQMIFWSDVVRLQDVGGGGVKRSNVNWFNKVL